MNKVDIHGIIYSKFVIGFNHMLEFSKNSLSGVPVGPCGIDEIKQFQTYLSEYQINIMSKECQDTILYSGPAQEKIIYLYLHDNHYEVITSMPGFLHTMCIVIHAKKPTITRKIICAPTCLTVTLCSFAVFEVFPCYFYNLK